MENTTPTIPAVYDPMQNLCEALARAQAKFDPIKKNKSYKISNTEVKYADLGSILAAVTPALSSEKLALTFEVDNGNSGASTECVLHGCGAELRSGRVFIALPKNVANAAQAAGSALTYGRRYALCALLGIAPDDDVDGRDLNESEASKPAAAPVSAELKARATEAAGYGRDAFNEFWSKLKREEKAAIVSNKAFHDELKALTGE